MIDTHYSLYRILPNRLINRISLLQKPPSDKRPASHSRNKKSQSDVTDDVPKGNNFDEFV